MIDTSEMFESIGNFVNTFSWVFLTILAIPTLLIMGSWSSLPGSPMYPVKLGLERVLLFVAKPSYQASAALNMKYTQRRLSEANVLLANDNSGKGLSYLSQQVLATQEVINRAPDPVSRKKLATQYIATLKQASQDLATQKQHIQTVALQANGFVPSPTGSSRSLSLLRPTSPPPVVQPTVGGSLDLPTPTEVPTQPANDPSVIQQIDDTQNQIDNTISNLESLSTQDALPPTPTEVPTQPPAPTDTPEPSPTLTQQQNVQNMINNFQNNHDNNNDNNNNGNGNNNNNNMYNQNNGNGKDN